MNDTEQFLAHYGKKGMKWGVRKESASAPLSGSLNGTVAGSGRPYPQAAPAGDVADQKAARKAKAKKIAIGVGILAAVAGTAYVAHQVNQNGGRQVKDLPKTKPSVKKKTESIMTEPTDVIYSTRNKNQGFSFRRDGNLPDPLNEYDQAFGGNQDTDAFFRRYGKDNEKVAARFLDPEGRKDAAGRVIPHEVIVPKSMASGINNLDDVRSKIWPSLKDEYARGYDTPQRGHR